MKHRRSIDLVASHEEVATDRETLATLPLLRRRQEPVAAVVITADQLSS